MCFFAVTGGTETVIVFHRGNGLHGNHRSLTAVKIPRETPEESPVHGITVLRIQINHHAGTPKHNNYKRHDILG